MQPVRTNDVVVDVSKLKNKTGPWLSLKCSPKANLLQDKVGDIHKEVDDEEQNSCCSSFRKEELKCFLLKCPADSLRVQNLALSKYEVYATSNMMSQPILLTLRTVLFLVMFLTFVRSVWLPEEKYWWYYLTHWGLFCENIYLFLCLILTVVCQCKLKSTLDSSNGNDNDDCNQKCESKQNPPYVVDAFSRLVQALHVVMVIISFNIACLFWLCVYVPGDAVSGLTFLVHGANVLVMLVDFATTSIPFHFLPAMLYSEIFASVYVFWSIIQYATPFPIDGRLYVYPVLNWSLDFLPATFTLVMGLLLVVLPAQAWVFCLLSRCREAARLKAVRMDQAMEGIELSKPVGSVNARTFKEEEKEDEEAKQRQAHVDEMMKMRKAMHRQQEQELYTTNSIISTLTPKRSSGDFSFSKSSYSKPESKQPYESDSESKNKQKSQTSSKSKMLLAEIFTPRRMERLQNVFASSSDSVDEVHV